jgi:uncharacterized repeat protein (TIGR02543 family)
MIAASLVFSGILSVAGLTLATPSGAADTPISSFVDAPEAIANDGSHLWVVNSTDDSVTELNLDGSFVQNIPVGVAPDAVAADGTNVWVVNSGSGTVTELTSNGSFVQTISVGGQPTGISSDGSDVWITQGPDDQVIEIDASTGMVVDGFSVNGDPTGISSDGTNVWIANSLSGNVTQYNIADQSVVNTITVGDSPTGVYSDGQYVWVANSGDGTVTVLNASDGSYAFDTDAAPVQVGNDPTGIWSEGADAWVTNTGDGTVSELAIVGGAIGVTATDAVGNGPAAVALDGTHVWADNAGDGTVSELDTTTGDLLTSLNVVDDSGLQTQTIPVGSWPSAVSTDGVDTWVTNSTDDTVSELNDTTSTLVQTIPVGGDPSAISSDGTHVWLINYADQSITVLNASDGSYAFGTGSAPIMDPDNPQSISSDGTHVWITNTDGTITVLNASDGTFAFGTGSAPISDPDGPENVSSDGTHVWIGNYDGTVSVLNATDGTFAFGTLNSPIQDPDGLVNLVSDGTHVWLANGDGTMTVLNASDGSYALGTGGTPLILNNGCSSAVASNGAAVWVTSQCSQNAIELDASSGAIIQDTVLEYSPVALSLDDSGDVWLANPYVGDAFSLANGGTGSYDGADDPNDQGTITELSSPPPLVTSSTDTTETQTFNYSPNVQTFTVPAGVTQLTLSANGGEGGRGGRDSSGRPPLGGYQGVVSGTISVTPGEVLTIGVGHGGHDSPIAETCTEGLNSLFDPEDAIGGSNPLGSYAGGNGGAAGEEGCSGYGAGGGAASVVEIGSSSNDPTSVATIVAGGSGGSGGSGQYPRTLGQVSLTSFDARSDITSTDGQAGLSVYNACIGAPSCDGGGGAAGGGGVQGGTQGLVEFGSGESNEWFGLGGSPGGNSTGELSGLSAQYMYYGGDGTNGSVVISYPTGLPGIPTNVVVTPAASTVGVVWNAPNVIGSSALVDYILRYSNDGGATWTTQDLDSTSTSTTLNLADGAIDVYEVAAVNHSGQGGWSVLASPPAAPTLIGITAGNEYVSVSFLAGATGGSPIIAYQYSLDGGVTWQNTNGVASPTLLSGLMNGTTYTVELRAVNAAGTGSISNPETATPFTDPSTPDATTFVTTSHDGQIGIAWTPSNDNGSPVSEYTITLYDSSFAGNQIVTCDVSDLTCYDGNTTSVSGTYSISDCTLTSLSCTITGLTNYTTYWVSIQASNAAGASGRSAPLVPAVPALVSVSYDPNGGTGAISSSSYEVGLPGVTLPTSGVTKQGYLLSGWSTVANDVTTEVTSPYVPPSPVAPTTTAYQTLYALWTPVLQYSVTYDGNGSTGGTVPVDVQSPYSADVDATVLGNTGALLDTGYVFAGWNTQADGEGTPFNAGASFEVLANTVLYAQWTIIQWLPPASPIPLPLTPTVTPPGIALDPSAIVTGRHAVISWSPPSSDGGSSVTGYTVTNADGVVVCTTTEVLSCAISNLVGKGPFVFTIMVSNAVGSGLGENFTAHVTPLACGSAGAPKCVTHTRNVVFGVVYFATGQYAIAGSSHATLEAIAKSVVAYHARTVNVVGAADVRGNAAQNDVLSLRRARSTVASLRTLLRSMHYALPRFVVKAHGESTKYAGLAKNRRTTISGVIDA